MGAAASRPCSVLSVMRPEDDPIFSSYILATVADWQELVWKQHIHPVYVRWHGSLRSPWLFSLSCMRCALAMPRACSVAPRARS